MDARSAVKEEAKQLLQKLVFDRGIRLDGSITSEQKAQLSRYLDKFLARIAKTHQLTLDKDQLMKLNDEIVSEFVGYGILEQFLKDPKITDIMVNSAKQIFIEKEGRLERVNISFRNQEELMGVVQKMVADNGKRLDLSSPFVDLKVHGTERATAIIPPVATGSVSLCIRKVLRDVLTSADLLRLRSVSAKALDFLKYCVRARLNILISGSTGVGKTTLINLLIREFVPSYARLIIIEETEEITVDDSQHSVKLATRPPNIEGKGEVGLADLVRLALRLRPDRIIIGEILGDEAFHFLHAINTGHEGSMCTIHANNSEDAVMRLETLSLMSGHNISASAVRRFLNAGLDLVVHMKRLPNGQRAISQISEFAYEDGNVAAKDIFSLARQFSGEQEIYNLEYTGYQPSFMSRLVAKAHIPEDFFKV